MISFILNNRNAGCFLSWILCAAALALSGACAFQGTPVQTAEPLPPGVLEYTLEHQGLSREYLAHIPQSYEGLQPVPLVLAFHGRGGSGRDQLKLSGLNEVSDENGFIVVYPEGVKRSWNTGHVAGKAGRMKVDDVGFVDALIHDLQGKYRIDGRRVYAAGMSNGGAFVHRLGCELGDHVAAVASVAGSISPKVARACRTVRPVPVMIIHGEADPVVPYDGGVTKGEGLLLSIDGAAGFWRRRNNCSPGTKVTYRKGGVTCETSSSNGRGEVTVCRVRDGGHTWPGGRRYAPEGLVGDTNRDFKASERIWEFFARHAMAEPKEQGGDDL